MGRKLFKRTLAWSSDNKYSEMFYVPPGVDNVRLELSASLSAVVYVNVMIGNHDPNDPPSQASGDWQAEYLADGAVAYKQFKIGQQAAKWQYRYGPASLTPGWCRFYSSTKPAADLTCYVVGEQEL